MSKRSDKVDVSFVHGWVHGRLATEDETEGHEQIVPGRHWRIKCASVMAYSQLEAGVLEIITDVATTGDECLCFNVIGTIEQLDKVMARFAIREIVDDG